MRKSIVTTPLFYVNSSPHIGHAYSAVLGDALNRWQGRGSRLLVGTDEHGQKILAAAKDRGKEPQMFCDEISTTFKNSFGLLGVNYDAFVRTTSDLHGQTVKALWSRLRPHMQMGKHEGWYCASDEAFVPASSVDEKTKTLKDSKHTVEWVSEPNYQFKFNPRKLKMELEQHCKILPGTSRRNEVLSMLDSSGEEQFISVSRPRHRVPWAIAVPDDDSQSIYVWVDALAGYLTAAGCVINPDPTSKEALIGEDNFDNVTHIVGKDILKFHCVHWPAFLMAAGIPIPSRVIAHAHWTVNRTKMSKSLKNVVCPTELLTGTCKNQPDVLRYFLLRDGRLEDDADFSNSALIERCDADLADNVGNLLNRVCAESIWSVLSNDEKVFASFEHSLKRRKLFEEVNAHYSQADFGKGLEALMRFMNDANAEYQQRAPWVEARRIRKNEGDVKESVEKLKACLGNSMDACRTAAVLLAPVTPTLSQRMFGRLGLVHDPNISAQEACNMDVVYGRPLLQGQVLMTKLGVQIPPPQAAASASSSAATKKKQESK